MENKLIYWKAINDLLKWSTYKKNCLILDILYTHKLSFEEFFNLSPSEMKDMFKLPDASIEALKGISSQIPAVAFELESINKQGIEIIALNDEAYSDSLKKLLKKSAPTLLYVKGDKALLNKKTAAVVGSRDVSEKGMIFTKNISKKCVKNNYVISSGYARGVDRIALETALQYEGKSIAVIPQGILTFKSELKKLYAQIVEGKVLVVSTFSPDAPWTAGRAMERNKYIYSLADNIYVAESGSEGGTWAGALEGLKAGQKVFVRYAEPDEKCANNRLIALGAKPVDMDGNELGNVDIPLEGEALLEDRLPEILKTLKERAMNAKQLIEMFELDITVNLLARRLKDISIVNSTTRNSCLYFYVGNKSEYEQVSLI